MEHKMIKIGEKNVTVRIGDLVGVSEPKYNDSFHSNAFTGTVVGFDGDCFIVEDADGEAFSIEDDEIEENFNS